MRQSTFFKLNKWNILVENEKKNKAAIYNLYTGDIIELDSKWQQSLHQLQMGDSLLSKKSSRLLEQIRRTLIEKKMGNNYSQSIYEEKERLGFLLPMSGYQSPPPRINKFFIQLPTGCDLNCYFCKSLKSMPCFSCTTEKSIKNVKYIDYCRILPYILELNPINIIFYGGNPFLFKDELDKLLNLCMRSSKRNSVWIVTHWRHLYSQIKRNEKKLGKNIMFYITIPLHDFINSKANIEELSFVLDNIKNYTKGFIPVLVEEVGYNDDEIISKVKRFNPKGIYFCYIFSKNNSQRFDNANLMRVNRETFWQNFYYHPCLHGTLALNYEGKILPCPYMKEEILCNMIKDIESFNIMFSDRKVDKYWNLNLGKIDNCEDCVFRFGCFECRAMELKLTNNLNGKLLCSRNKDKSH